MKTSEVLNKIELNFKGGGKFQLGKYAPYIEDEEINNIGGVFESIFNMEYTPCGLVYTFDNNENTNWWEDVEWGFIPLNEILLTFEDWDNNDFPYDIHFAYNNLEEDQEYDFDLAMESDVLGIGRPNYADAFIAKKISAFDSNDEEKEYYIMIEPEVEVEPAQ